MCRSVNHNRDDAVEKAHTADSQTNGIETKEGVLQKVIVLGLPRVQPFRVAMELKVRWN